MLVNSLKIFNILHYIPIEVVNDDIIHSRWQHLNRLLLIYNLGLMRILVDGSCDDGNMRTWL